jgi:hypothetical protein
LCAFAAEGCGVVREVEDPEAVPVGPLEVVSALVWCRKWTVLVKIEDCLCQVMHWRLDLLEKLEAVEALEEPLEEQCWQE